MKFKKFASIDAASSEFYTPPEVFSQVFRFLRKQNNVVKNYTYHVGEDFIHIVSGLRAIYEAIFFLEMECGNRLGHAAALGLCPKLWKERIGDTIYISKGEWIDNLIFIVHFLDLKSGKLFNQLKKQIERYSKGLYPYSKPSIENLILAWRFRKWDPDLFFKDKVSDADFDLRNECHLIKNEKLTNNQRKLIEYYFKNQDAKDRNEKILVNFDDISEEIVSRVQEKLSNLIRTEGIVVETLPTSNIRIGVYNNHNEHHLKKWMNPTNLANNLKVVVGSDDTGIFATNIYNEYAHVYLMYPNRNSIIINQLIQNSNHALF